MIPALALCGAIVDISARRYSLPASASFTTKAY